MIVIGLKNILLHKTHNTTSEGRMPFFLFFKSVVGSSADGWDSGVLMRGGELNVLLLHHFVSFFKT